MTVPPPCYNRRTAREHFSHTWLDRGGAEGDLSVLNGWTCPQMLRQWSPAPVTPEPADLVPARANGQPAFGAYPRVPAGIRHATGLYVLTLAGDRICAMTRFEASVLPWFGLPRSLPAR